MADDGILLNFSIGDGTLTSKAAFSGGPWRARRRVQKQTAAGGFRSAPVGQGDEQEDAQNEDSGFDSRPAKRVRTDDGTRLNSKSNHYQPKQFISSLFSYNPASTTTGAEKTEEEEEGKKEIPSNAPLPEELHGLTSLGLSPTLAAHLTSKLNVTAPTAIQKEAIPTLLANNTDAFIQAETGSGKTLAYLLPIIQRLMALPSRQNDGKNAITRDSGLLAIIMAPTRELSKQISIVLEGVLRCANWIVPGIVIGGEKKKSEKARLRKGVNILVATPGRLVDHLFHTKVLDVSNVRWLVLDEGDRLMELGFEDDIRKIVAKLDEKRGTGTTIAGLPANRSNILCSATMKMDVQRLGEISLKEAVHIRVERKESAELENEVDKFSAPAQLKQTYAIVPAKLRLVTLVAMLTRAFARKGSVMKIIVFMSCADSVDFHFEVLTRTDVPNIKDAVETPKANEKRPRNEKLSRFGGKPKVAASLPTDPTTFAPSPVISGDANPVNAYRLHGSLAQAVRTKTLQAFSKETSPAFLICTDVASRGLDLPNIDLVIEYDPPFSKEEHLHRIGRTARAGRDGRATIFLMPGSEEGYVNLLKEGRRDGVSSITRHTAEEILRKGFTTKVDGKVQLAGWDQRATDWELEIERWALEDSRVLEMARRAFQSHVRAYATHTAGERAMFNIKELHLGHLAKAFGLRDRPGSINVPGLRQSATQVRDERRKDRRDKHDRSGDQSEDEASGRGRGPQLLTKGDDNEAIRRMKKKMSSLGGGADEFNLA